MAQETELLVRLKPINEKKGLKTRTYMYDGARFYVEKGWYKVNQSLAKKLKDLHQEHYDEDSPFLFDVCTKAQAEALDAREAQAAIDEKASARNPQVVRTRQTPLGQLPINNAGGLEGIPQGGDVTTLDINGPLSDEQRRLLDPDANAADNDLENDDASPDGRITNLGRVDSSDETHTGGEPRARQKKK